MYISLTCLLVDSNDTRQRQTKLSLLIISNFPGKKKNWRMRILGAVFFLSFLAGKFATFKQMLLTD